MDEPRWRKATFSADNGCVELADLGHGVGVRDSKFGDNSPVLRLSREALADWLDGIRAGKHDDLL